MQFSPIQIPHSKSSIIPELGVPQTTHLGSLGNVVQSGLRHIGGS